MISSTGGANIFGPHHQRIWSIFQDAWAKYQAILKDSPFLADYPRARANFVHAAMKALALERFEGVTNTRVIPHEPDSFMVVFDEHVYTRFKKLDRDTLLTSNVATDQNDEMLRQLPLPGHGPNPSYPIAGYVLNKLQTAIESVHITLPMGDYNLWSYEINDEGAVNNVYIMPTLFPLDDLTKTVIKPKRQFKKDKQKNDEGT